MVMESYGRRVRTARVAGALDREAVIRGIDYLKRLLELPDPLRPVKAISVELWDGERASSSAGTGILREMKFRGGSGQSMEYDGY
jgi:hypothetical protein